MDVNSLPWNVIYSLTAGIVGSALTLFVEQKVSKEKIDNLKEELARVTNAINGGTTPELIADVKTKIKDLDNDAQEQKKKISDIKGATKFIKNDLKIINDDYQELCSFLEYFLENQDTIERTKKLLEVVSNNSQQSDTIVQLHKRISQVEITQKSQPIIKIGRIGLKHHQGFIQTEELQELQKENVERDKKIEVEFDNEFSRPRDVKFSSPPDVYVALAMVDGQYNGECEKPSLKFGCNTKVHVFAESVSEEKFTLKVRTWDRSKIWNIDAIWIAIGK